MLRTDTCIAYFPAKDFNGKVRLFVIGALTIVKNGVSCTVLLLLTN